MLDRHARVSILGSKHNSWSCKLKLEQPELQTEFCAFWTGMIYLHVWVLDSRLAAGGSNYASLSRHWQPLRSAEGSRGLNCWQDEEASNSNGDAGRIERFEKQVTARWGRNLEQADLTDFVVDHEARTSENLEVSGGVENSASQRHFDTAFERIRLQNMPECANSTVKEPGR